VKERQDGAPAPGGHGAEWARSAVPARAGEAAGAGTVEVVCRPGVASGFALAGLRPHVADDAEEAARTIHALLTDPATRPAVLLLEEGLQSGLPPALARRLSREPGTLTVPFPSPRAARAAGEAERFLLEILRQAIGYRVRL
jgi:vacuolar-type H+-ATPase subunit F/Vma7